MSGSWPRRGAGWAPAIVLAVAGCCAPQTVAPPPPVVVTPGPPTPAKPDEPDEDLHPLGEGVAPDETIDEDAAEAERVAAIEAAMNQLAPAANLCWGAAAADDYQLAGELVVTATFAASGPPAVVVGRDTARDPVLAACMTKVVGGHRWPRVFAVGESIQLPFAFAAPRAQYVVDRRFVKAVGQQGIDVAVLLDQQNTGASVAAMLAVTVPAGGALPQARADRDEVWIFLDAARLHGPDGVAKARDVAALDAAFLPRRAIRALLAPKDAAAHVLILAVPGGREGVARAGALPVQKVAVVTDKGPIHPIFISKAAARRFPRSTGASTILVEPAKVKSGAISVAILEASAGASIAAHRHATETEVLYLLAGSGVMKIDGVELAVGPTSVVQIPAGLEHSFVAAEDVVAIQAYVPAGPEQRFKSMK